MGSVTVSGPMERSIRQAILFDSVRSFDFDLGYSVKRIRFEGNALHVELCREGEVLPVVFFLSEEQIDSGYIIDRVKEFISESRDRKSSRC